MNRSMRRTMRLWICAALLLSLPAGADGDVEEVDLSKYERTVHAQFGEDGVVEKIFELIEPTHKFAVEFGASDGIKDNNMRRLILEEGWGGLQMEGNREQAERLHATYRDNPKVKTRQAWIYPGNIEILFEENGVPKDFDYLVIDIDSNDYYVWRAIQQFRPKVVQIEYNAAFAPPQLAVVDFHPLNYWDFTDYYGASIQSLYELGKKKGYELVYGNQAGNNLFFVDGKYYDRFGLHDNSPQRFYRAPTYGIEAGGRAPNGRGFKRYETKPVLTWEKVRIRKKMVER